MNKFFTFIILMIIYGTNLYSQNTNLKSDLSEIRKNKFQVELGFRTIQNVYNNTAAATIMFKKKYNRGELIDVASLNFLRTYFTLNSNINFRKDTFARKFAFNPRSAIDMTIGLGIEKQFQNRRLVHYFGCDIFTNYSDVGTSRAYSFSSSFNNYEHLYQYEKTINSGLIPFIGLKYYISDQLNIGIETGLSISYYHSKFSETQYSVVYINGQEEFSHKEFIPIIQNGLKFNFLGIRFITLGYSFK